MKISKLMTQPVRRIDAGLTTLEVAEVIVGEGVRSLLVTNGENPIGILTQDDIILGRKGRLEETRVRDVMATAISTIDKDATHEDAIKTMIENGVRRLLVTDKGRSVGIFTISDVTKHVPVSTIV